MALHGFDELVEALAGALVHARETVERQHLRTIQNYFTRDGDKLVAKTTTIHVPDLDSNGEPELEVKVPLFSLLPLSSLTIDEVTVEFDAYLSTLSGDSDKSKGPKKMQMELGGHGMMGKSKNNVKVSVKVKGGNPPEGLIKLNDNIVKSIP